MEPTSPWYIQFSQLSKATKLCAKKQGMFADIEMTHDVAGGNLQWQDWTYLTMTIAILLLDSVVNYQMQLFCLL